MLYPITALKVGRERARRCSGFREKRNRSRIDAGSRHRE